MGLEDILNRKIEGTMIVNPLSEIFERLCIEKGNNEIKEIMDAYSEAVKEAGDIFVKSF